MACDCRILAVTHSSSSGVQGMALYFQICPTTECVQSDTIAESLRLALHGVESCFHWPLAREGSSDASGGTLGGSVL